ncbi:MAG: hypothetical protein ACYS0F_14995, partial [Planctomycetota bacterium]
MFLFLTLLLPIPTFTYPILTPTPAPQPPPQQMTTPTTLLHTPVSATYTSLIMRTPALARRLYKATIPSTSAKFSPSTTKALNSLRDTILDYDMLVFPQATPQQIRLRHILDTPNPKGKRSILSMFGIASTGQLEEERQQQRLMQMHESRNEELIKELARNLIASEKNKLASANMTESMRQRVNLLTEGFEDIRLLTTIQTVTRDLRDLVIT